MCYVDLQSQTPIQMSPTIQQSILGTITEINNVYKLGKRRTSSRSSPKLRGTQFPKPGSMQSTPIYLQHGLASQSSWFKNIIRKHRNNKSTMQSNRANVRSTKLLPNQEFHETTTTEVLHHEFFIKTVELSGKIYSDQTGRLPLTSSKGNRYVMIVYDNDSNAILAEPLKLRSAENLLADTAKIHIFLRERAIHPKIHIMDNGC